MKKIILVEDDPAIRDVFVMALDPEKYEINVLTKGDSIIEHLAKTPDLFLLDKNISGTNGLDICRFIKTSNQYQHVPVIIVSASPDLAETAQEAGATDIIAKPFSLSTLREMILRYTEERETETIEAV